MQTLKYCHKPFKAFLQSDTVELDNTEIVSDCMFLIVQGTTNLFLHDALTEHWQLYTANFAELNDLGLDSDKINTQSLYLGEFNDKYWFVLSVNELQVSQLNLSAQHTFSDLRYIGRHLDDTDAAIAAYARGIVHFHENTRYCHRCGSQTQVYHHGVARQCSNQHCQYTQFARIDPAVIVLVTTHINGIAHCLLGHNHRFADGFYSAIAGFVDLGETLEQAAAREVYEETGIEIENIHYAASQPWPFPQSLMLGFYARAKTQQIHLLDGELTDARWFNAQQISEFGEMGHQEKPYMLPSQTSIAHFLIQNWLKNQ